MTPFEEQLKEALARREPPEGFTNRVLERTIQRTQERALARSWRFREAWAWRLAPVLLALLLVTGGAIYHERQQMVRGEAAKEKLLTAVRIAGSKLHETRQHLIEIEGTEVER
jgi:hypothetical protein